MGVWEYEWGQTGGRGGGEVTGVSAMLVLACVRMLGGLNVKACVFEWRNV